MIVKTFLILDKLMEQLWRKMLALLCAATGRSNFFFARAAIMGGTILVVAALPLTFLLEPMDATRGLGGVIGTFGIGALSRMKLSCTTQLEDAAERGSNVIPASAEHIKMLVAIRVVLTVVGLVFVMDGRAWLAPVVGGGVVLAEAGAYFMFDYRPRKKSPIVRLIGAAKKKLATLKLPVPEPYPSSG